VHEALVAHPNAGTSPPVEPEQHARIQMPKSKVRKKTAYTPPIDRRTPVKVRAAGPSNLFYKVVMFGLMLLGLIWLVVNYIAGDKIGFMIDLGNWNFAIGFALMIGGLLMTMRWR
jgi:hypothetical protein